MYNYSICIAFFLVFFSSFLFAQLPSTDVYLFDLELNDGQVILENARLLTANNPESYNNQPYFIGDELFITAQSQAEDNQERKTDIYAFHIEKKEQRRITWTNARSEYSPMPVPNSSDLSFVCVEEDETQRIWKVSQEADGPPSLFLENLVNVGYYLWLDYEYIVSFIVGEPHSLVLYNTKSNESSMITQKPGRGLQLMPNGNLAYVSKPYNDKWLINEYNLKDASSTPIIPCLAKAEDFIFLEDGTIIMASGPKLYEFAYPNGLRWKEIADFSGIGITKITRLAINKETSKLALVSVK